MTYYTECPSPVGLLTIACGETQVTGLWLTGQKYFAAGLSPAAERRDTVPPLQEVCAWLVRYFAGERPAPPTVPLAPAGTAFQKRVWEMLRTIPCGGTTTYARLAERLGTSARAVGAAVGRNPISILIPCHRVLGADGALTGYAGGLEAKQFLLNLERE